MELALILVLLVIAELIISVWMLAKHKSYMKRVVRLERNVRKLAEVMEDMASDKKVSTGAVASDGQDLASLIAQAKPEDFEQAQKVLASLGLNQDLPWKSSL